MPLPWQVFAECLLFSLASILFFLLLLLFKMKRYKWTSCCCCCCRVSSSVAASLEAAHGPVNILSVHSCLSSSLLSCRVVSCRSRPDFCWVFMCSCSSRYSRTFSIKHRLAGQYFGFCFLYVFCLLGHAYGHPLFFLRPILWRVHNLSFTELLSCTMGRNIIKS